MAGKKKPSFTETDLAAPLVHFLERNGYTVHSEVNHCDLTAVKGEELIVIELKKTINVPLLIQATQRQKITDSVYVAVPTPKGGIHCRSWRKIEHLLKRLELGAILIDPQRPRKPVTILHHPLPFQRKKQPAQRRALLQEMDSRSGDYNTAGSVRQKQVTAYREEAIHIACLLETYGEMTPKQLRALGSGPKTQSILYANHYDWFERLGRGLYHIKPKTPGKLRQFADVVAYYKNKIHQEKKD